MVTEVDEWPLMIKTYSEAQVGLLATLGQQELSKDIIPERPIPEVVGRKDDNGKNRFDLIPWKALNEMVKVLTWGATHYGDRNWMLVKNPRARYFAALHRHLYKWIEGEIYDPQTSVHHLGHAGVNVLFLLALDLEGKCL